MAPRRRVQWQMENFWPWVSYFLTMRPALNFALEGVVLGLAGQELVIFSIHISLRLFSLSMLLALMYTPIVIVSVNNTAHLFTSVYWILFFSISGLWYEVGWVRTVHSELHALCSVYALGAIMIEVPNLVWQIYPRFNGHCLLVMPFPFCTGASVVDLCNSLKISLVTMSMLSPGGLSSVVSSVAMLLLLLAGDVETNPGPGTAVCGRCPNSN